MPVRSNASSASPRDAGEPIDETVVWPEPSPLSSWWQQVMKTPKEGRPAPGAA